MLLEISVCFDGKTTSNVFTDSSKAVLLLWIIFVSCLSRFLVHRRHCVVSLSKNINPSLVLVPPRKTCPFITESLFCLFDLILYVPSTIFQL